MARDAISRQYDVDKNLVTLTCENRKERYSPGLITFHAKKGKSLDLGKIHESITATRLSGGTSMSVDYLEITARGTAVIKDKDVLLKVSDSDQEFILGEDPAKKETLARLREALGREPKMISVTGRVAGWTGRFPDVLKKLEARPPGPMPLSVMSFEAK